MVLSSVNEAPEAVAHQLNYADCWQETLDCPSKRVACISCMFAPNSTSVFPKSSTVTRGVGTSL